MTADPSCPICKYWVDAIDAARARALKKSEGACADERRLNQELREHIERTHHDCGE
jgi:hypothetical protein